MQEIFLLSFNGLVSILVPGFIRGDEAKDKGNNGLQPRRPLAFVTGYSGNFFIINGLNVVR